MIKLPFSKNYLTKWIYDVDFLFQIEKLILFILQNILPQVQVYCFLSILWNTGIVGRNSRFFGSTNNLIWYELHWIWSNSPAFKSRDLICKVKFLDSNDNLTIFKLQNMNSRLWAAASPHNTKQKTKRKKRVTCIWFTQWVWATCVGSMWTQ